MICKLKAQIGDSAQFISVLSVKRSATRRAAGPAKAHELEPKTPPK